MKQFLSVLLGLGIITISACVARRPNFVVILVDDLDEAQDCNGDLAMPATKRLLRDRGVTFTNHFVTTPICCPSRVNLLRGQLSHNTNFTDVLGPHGGYAKFRALGLDREWLPTWLQQAGYNTLYTGKFIVDYTIRNFDPAPSGWTVFDALVHPFTFEYYSPAFSLNGGQPRMYPAQYSTDVVAAKALAMLRSAAADPSGRPFYLQVAPPAPHHSMHYDFNASGAFVSRHWYPPVPAARHWEELSGAALPRPPSFNDPWVIGKPAWLRALDPLTVANITFLEEIYRLRLRCMRAVDEMVEALVNELDSLGLSDSTFILFTSDNGYHEGVHRMGSGKTTAFEEDLRVPMMMAGPGLAAGARVGTTTQHIDIAPTVLTLAGLPRSLPQLDGVPLPLAAVSDGTLQTNYVYGRPDQGPLRNHLVAEFWGEWVEESIHSHPPYANLTWKAVRVLRSDQEEAYKYVLHCSGEFELYDLIRDPYERINLLSPLGYGGASVSRTGSWWSSARFVVSSAVQASYQDGHVNAINNASAAAAISEAAAAARAWARTVWAAVVTSRTRGSVAAANGRRRRSTASQQEVMAVDRLASGDYVKWLLRIRSRLDAMLAVLAVCSGRACSHPFQVLHTDGRVSDLWAAMDEQYDSMYDAIPPFSFSRCLPYQDLENERSMFRGAVVPDCTGEGAALGAPGRELADVGPHAGSRKSDGSSSSTAGDINCGSSTSGSDGDRSGRSTADGATFVMVESQIESAAVPLPAKYRLVTDVYGNSAARDSILLA